MHPRLTELFQTRFGSLPAETKALRAHGSDRKLYRLLGPGPLRAVGVDNPDREENRAFVEFSRHFRQQGLPVPVIFAEDPEAGVYLEEDLGDTTLFEFLQARRGEADIIPPEVAELYRRSVSTLARFQVQGARGIDLSLCYPHSAFDRRSMSWDLNYFKYYFLKLAQVPYNEQRLENDFETFCNYLLSVPRDTLLYRDFQSRNIMVRDGEPWLIDYQGCRMGALHYDLASLLLDAKANLPLAFREELKQHYLGAVSKLTRIDQSRFEADFRAFSLIRILQAMGAYGYRGFYERKTHFLQSVPYAIRNLEHLMESGDFPVAMPELTECLRRIVASTRLRSLASTSVPLTVRVESFSFKQGYPVDRSGHGGGFVFDCRALPNPGRELRFKTRSGRDEDVKEWLRQHDEVALFLAQVRNLLLPSIETYQKRSFTHLAVSFGCTGGQHRSVYCAEALAAWLSQRAGLQVELTHREQDKWPKA